MWSRGRLTRKQLTSRPDHLWPELWISMGKHAKLKEKQKWSNEKLHLENARKLRGIYFIDPEDKEFEETIKNARKKLETPMAPAMPCKIMKKNCGIGASATLQFGTQIYSYASTKKIPAAKAAVDKEWEKFEKIPAWDLTTVRSKSEVIDEARTKGSKVHFASLMDICHLKNAELETKGPKIKRSSCIPR